MKFKFRIFYGIELEQFNRTPLILAAFVGCSEVVQELLSHEGIDINWKDVLIQKHS